MTRINYRRLTGEQISHALADLQISPSRFAKIAGINDARLRRALASEPDFELPHTAALVLVLLHLPNAMSLVDAYNHMMFPKESA